MSVSGAVIEWEACGTTRPSILRKRSRPSQTTAVSEPRPSRAHSADRATTAAIADARAASSAARCGDGPLDPADAERQRVADLAGDRRGPRIRPRRPPSRDPAGLSRSRLRPGQDARADRRASPQAIVDRGHSLLVTRTDAAAYDAVAKVVPDAVFHEHARIIERRGRRAARPGSHPGRSSGNF